MPAAPTKPSATASDCGESALAQCVTQLVRRYLRDLDGNAEGAELHTLVMHNAAPWTQPYPLLEVRLSDLAGHAVAARVFAPTTYLPDAALATRGLPPDARAAISIEIRDPGRQAVAFEIVPR